MKLLFLSIGILFAFQNIALASALEWSDLDLYSQYTLNQSITFPGLMTINSGEKLEMIDLEPGGPPFIYYQMHLINCKDPDMTSEMILVNPSPNDQSTDRSVGIVLDAGCNLSIWVEGKDYYGQSLFSEY